MSDTTHDGRRFLVKTFSGATFEIWAAGGGVWLEDQSDGEAIWLTQEEVLERFTQAGILNKIADRYSTSDTFFRAIRDADRPLVDALHEVLKDARAQGDPMDDVEVETMKIAAETRTDLMAYDKPQKQRHPLFNDPRVYFDKAGRPHLRHGMGERPQKKHYGPG